MELRLRHLLQANEQRLPVGLLVLSNDSQAMQAQLDTVWQKARRRQNGQAGFILELYIYVPKPAETTTLRRATAARIQEQIPRVAEMLRAQGVAAGNATRTYMAVTQARLPENAAVAVPDNTTFRQLQHVDAEQAAMDNAMQEDQLQASAEYQLVRIKIHDVPVAMQVNVADLRAVLGLPSYSLRPPFRESTEINTQAPAANVLDTDHMQD